MEGTINQSQVNKWRKNRSKHHGGMRLHDWQSLHFVQPRPPAQNGNTHSGLDPSTSFFFLLLYFCVCKCVWWWWWYLCALMCVCVCVLVHSVDPIQGIVQGNQIFYHWATVLDPANVISSKLICTVSRMSIFMLTSDCMYNSYFLFTSNFHSESASLLL